MKMKTRTLILGLLISIFFFINNKAIAQQIMDDGIRSIVFSQLSVSEERELTREELASITEINAVKQEEKMIDDMDVFWMLKTVKSLEDLKLFPNLERLVLTSSISSLEGIQQATNLKAVELHYCPADDFYLLATLPKLESLVIYEKYTSPLTFLSRLEHLKSFRLFKYGSGGYRTESIESINGLIDLEELHVIGLSPAELSYLDLASFPKLKRLALSAGEDYEAGGELELKLRELQECGILGQIEEMMLIGLINNNVLSIIGTDERLCKLDLDDSIAPSWEYKEQHDEEILDFSRLKQCGNLEVLVLGSFRSKRITKLEELTQLHDLRLFESCEAESFELYSKLENLESLIIWSLQRKEPIILSEFSKYGTLRNLKELEIYTDIIDLEGLEKLKALKELKFDFQSGLRHPEALLDYKGNRGKIKHTVYAYAYSIKRDSDYNQFYIFDN